MGVDVLRESFRSTPTRAGNNLQDHVEALARLNHPRVGYAPTQGLQLGEVRVKSGNDLRVHSASQILTAPTATPRVPGPPRTRGDDLSGETGDAYFFLALDLLSFLSFLSFFAMLASSTVGNRRATRER